jgi:hypothetical protein
VRFVKTSVVRFKPQLLWTVRRDRVSKRWIGVCEELKFCLEDTSYERLLALIDEALEELLKLLLRKGELADWLKEHHVRLASPLPRTSHRARFKVSYTVKQHVHHDPAQIAA